MSTESVGARGGGWGMRLLVLVPIVLLVAIAAAFVSSGGSITRLVGKPAPPADTLDLRRVEFHPGEIRVLVRNPQRRRHHDRLGDRGRRGLPFTTDGPDTIGRLRSTTIEDPVRLGRGRPVHDRGHQLDRASRP